MRFRAQVTNFATLVGLIEGVSKLAKRSIFKFTKTNVLVIVAAAGSEMGLQVWATLNVVDVFTNYRIESNAGDEICLELTTQALLSALKGSMASATEVVLRLSKKDKLPILSLGIKNVSKTGAEYDLTQEILVRVLKPSDANALKEPLCPDPDVHILLPPMSQIRVVADKLKVLSTVCCVRANMLGEFRLGVNSEHAKVETEWRGLKHPETKYSQASQQSEPTSQEPSYFREVSVRSKALSTLLSSHTIGGKVIACIFEDYALVLFIYLGPSEAPTGILTAYFPSINEDGDG